MIVGSDKDALFVTLLYWDIGSGKTFCAWPAKSKFPSNYVGLLL